MQRSPLGRAPNYTTPALIMGFVNLLWIFIAIWAIWGWLVVALVAVILNWAIDRLVGENRRRS